MANEFVEVVSRNANKQIQDLIKGLEAVKKNVNDINANPVILPSQGRGNNQQLAQEVQRLNALLIEQGKVIERLTATRSASNQRTTEEIVNTRLLAQNANRAALANSTFANSYQRLSAEQSISAARVQDLVARGRLATQTQRQYDAELRVAQREFTQLNNRVIAADRAVGRFNRNVGNYPAQAARGLKDLLMAFGVVGGLTAFASITKDIINTTRELQSLDLALSQVLGSEMAAAEAMEFLTRISESYGIELKGLTRSYTQFYAASQNAIESGAITAQQIQDIFESVSKASGAMGLSVEQQQGAFLALQQMISKGTVQAEEIRGQLAERLPGAFGILAKSMGVTEMQLNKLLKDGKVLAAEVLPAFAKQLEKAYGVENLTRVESMAAETSRLRNEWTEFVRGLNEGSGIISKAFIGIINELRTTIKFYKDLNKTEKDRQKDLEKGSYNIQIKQLKELSKASKEAYATDILQSGAQIVGDLERQNKVIRENIKELTAKLKAEENVAGFDFLSRTQWDIDKQTKQLKANTNEITVRTGAMKAAVEALRIVNKEETKPDKELSDKERKALEKLNQERLENQYRLRKLILESERETFNESMNDTSLYYEQRIQAAEDVTSKEIELAELARKEGLRKAGNNKTLQLIIWEEYYKDFREIATKGEKNITDLQEKSFEDFKAYHDKFEGEGLNLNLNEKLSNQWFEKQKQHLEDLKARTKELKKETDDYLRGIREGFVSDAGLGSINIFFDKTFNELTGKFESTFDKLYEGAENSRERFQVAFSAISEVAQEAFNLIANASKANFDLQYEALAKEKEVALKFAGESTAGREEIESQYEERRKAIRRKEAESQKEQALFNAIINTAQAVVAALPNVALSVIIGAIGAAQIAMIASQQIPQFKDGVKNFGGGLAVVGDGGRSEIIQTASGELYKTPSTDTLVNLPKGSNVYKSELDFVRNSGGLYSNISSMPVQNNSISRSEMQSIMDNSISKVKPFNMAIDKNGMRSWIGSERVRTENMNNIVSFKSVKV